MKIELKSRINSFTRKRDLYVDHRERGVVCASGLRKKISLPRNTKNLDIVFTKKPNRDSFTLTLKSFVDCMPGVEEFKGALYDEAQEYIERAYLKGYRYVHIEY